MKELIFGEKIKLRPAAPQDKRKVFDWLTNSNLTKERRFYNVDYNRSYGKN